MGALFLLMFVLFVMCIVYPVGGVAYYKLVKHSTKTINQILDEEL